MTTHSFSFAKPSKLIIVSLDQTLPVGFEGELIITPFTRSEILDSISWIVGSKFRLACVSISTGVASESVTNSGNDTQ